MGLDTEGKAGDRESAIRGTLWLWVLSYSNDSSSATVTQSWPVSPRFFLLLGQETTLEQMKTIQFYSQLSDFTHLCGFQSWHSTRLRKSGLRQAHLEGKNRRFSAALASSTSTDVEPWECVCAGPGVNSFPFKSMLACVSMCPSINAARALQRNAQN